MQRALLVIDVQMEYFTGALPVTHPAGSLGRILSVMDAAQAAGLPIAVIQHHAPQPEAPAFRHGSPGWQLHPEVERRPHSILIHKQRPGSFTGTGLEAWLREHGVDTLTICGYMTQMCCDTTARQAWHLDYAVEFLADATGTLAFSTPAGTVTAEELHRATLVTQSLRFSRVLGSAEWLDALRAGRPAA